MQLSRRGRRSAPPLAAILLALGCIGNETVMQEEAQGGRGPIVRGGGGGADHGGGRAGEGAVVAGAAGEGGVGGTESPPQAGAAGSSPDGQGGSGAAGSAPVVPPGNGLRQTVCGSTAWMFTTKGIGQPEIVAEAGEVDGGQRAFTFLEGPVWRAADATLLFSDFNTGSPLNDDAMGPPTIIWKLGSDGAVKAAFAEGAIRANGMAIDDDGNVLVADHGIRGLSRVAKDGARTVVVDTFEGKPFNAPNDLVATSDGSIYFTDPAYNGQVDGREKPIGHEGVYRVAPKGQVQLVDKTLKRPNGITTSLDEKWLYVSAKDESTIYRYPLTDGVAGAKQPFITGQAADGVTLDCAGNLYLAVPGKALRVFDPQGNKIWETLSRKALTNVAFGGAGHNVLYVTEQTRLYRIQMVTPGLPY